MGDKTYSKVDLLWAIALYKGNQSQKESTVPLANRVAHASHHPQFPLSRIFYLDILRATPRAASPTAGDAHARTQPAFPSDRFFLAASSPKDTAEVGNQREMFKKTWLRLTGSAKRMKHGGGGSGRMGHQNGHPASQASTTSRDPAGKSRSREITTERDRLFL